jgi:hypothetical protein
MGFIDHFSLRTPPFCGSANSTNKGLSILEACDPEERLWFEFFLMTGLREQEVMQTDQKLSEFRGRVFLTVVRLRARRSLECQFRPVRNTNNLNGRREQLRCSSARMDGNNSLLHIQQIRLCSERSRMGILEKIIRRRIPIHLRNRKLDKCHLNVMEHHKSRCNCVLGHTLPWRNEQTIPLCDPFRLWIQEPVGDFGDAPFRLDGGCLATSIRVLVVDDYELWRQQVCSILQTSPPQTMSGKTISGFSATGLIRRSDFTFGSSKFNTVIGEDVKFTIDVEIEKQ